jgi:hypothetical protein
MSKTTLVELLYFEGCPSWEQAFENLAKAMRLEGLTVPISKVLVTSTEDARRNHFLGSPTIRVDGRDVERPAATGRAFGLTCRLYQDGTHMVVSPSVEMIRQALQRG